MTAYDSGVNATGLSLSEIRALTLRDFTFHPDVLLWNLPGLDLEPEDVEHALQTAVAVEGCTVIGVDRDGVDLKVTVALSGSGPSVDGVGR